VLEDHAEAVAEAYDLGSVHEFTGPVARGQQGEVWRLHTDRGVWAVKRSFFEFPAADAQRAGTFQNLARASGVPTPVSMPTRAGHYGFDLAGTLVRVQSWVEVLGPDAMIDPARVGATVAALHRTVLAADAGPHPWYTDGIGADGWDEILAEARRQQAPFTDRLAGLRDELLALEALLTPMEPVQTCHLDLWFDNLRATPSGELCLLDWDNCGPGDPTRELALVLFDFARTSPDRMVALFGAYRDAGGPGRLHTRADFSLLIAQLGHIGAMQMRRWLDPGTSATERAYALQGAEEFLDDPLSRGTIDAILAAVT
jgi:aminoglycoside phosphotransferase (APT) family kinase protein